MRWNITIVITGVQNYHRWQWLNRVAPMEQKWDANKKTCFDVVYNFSSTLSFHDSKYLRSARSLDSWWMEHNVILLLAYRAALFTRTGWGRKESVSDARSRLPKIVCLDLGASVRRSRQRRALRRRGGKWSRAIFASFEYPTRSSP